MLGIQEFGLIGIALILLFGAPKVIEWAKALGQAKKEYNKAIKTDDISQ